MLSVESTPLRKESIELWEADARLDVDGAHTNAMLPGGTKVLQSGPGGLHVRLVVVVFRLSLQLEAHLSRAPAFSLVGSPSLMMYCIKTYFFFNHILFVPLVYPYTTVCKAELAHRSARALPERRAAGGSAHRSAHTEWQASPP